MSEAKIRSVFFHRTVLENLHELRENPPEGAPDEVVESWRNHFEARIIEEEERLLTAQRIGFRQSEVVSCLAASVVPTSVAS